MSITKFNKKAINWDIETKDWEFKKISTLEEGKVYPLKGMFVTRDHGYGEGATLISAGFLVDVPARNVALVREVCADPETVADIKAGKCGFKYSTFVSEKFKKTGYSIEFVEL